MYEDRGVPATGIEIIIEMKKYAQELSKKHGMNIALARTPAETTAQRFAIRDLRFADYRLLALHAVQGDKIEALKNLSGPNLPVYYTNGTHIPPGAPVDLLKRLTLEAKFFPVLDGGNIAHIWLGEAHPDPEGLYYFGMSLARNTNIGYFAFTKDFTICNECKKVESGLQNFRPSSLVPNKEFLESKGRKQAHTWKCGL
jgi:ribonucleoside-triphosphate reductase